MHNFNLQLFSGEKTEDATPKRKEEARKKGQVARSVELNSAFVILAAFFTLKVVGSYIYNELGDYMKLVFTHFSTTDFTAEFIQILFIDFAIVFFKVTLPVMLVIAVIAILSNLVQVGFAFSFEPIMPQMSRMNPISGLQRVFSKRSLVELAKSIVKISIIGYFVYRFIMKTTGEVPQLIASELADSLNIAVAMALDLVFQISAVMIALAAVDYAYQLWEHNESIKMSKQEVKEEYKQMEGNPQLKSKIKERQRAFAMQRMMQEVPKADVVITNPTHYAIALKYDQSMAAPIVVAKGQDFLAQRIKETAKENKVTIVENKPLARALYRAVDVGSSVPAELYQAVAEVLAYVYRLKKRLS
ncbi:MAG: flagellar biosynthesis protein FlhB [Negativicutes bacterium]|nr:flagellar biosynthesis protein FlhB [Negativicutes bacterium]